MGERLKKSRSLASLKQGRTDRCRVWNSATPATLQSLRAKHGETVKTARSLANLRQGRTDWYRLDNSADAATLYIYDEIGYFGVTAQALVADLAGIGNSDLTVHINSPGGDVFDGIAILNALRAHKGTVTTIVDGLAASAASFIAQAGSHRLMAKNAEVMIHDASGLCIGNASDMREMLELLERTSDNIASIYAERSGQQDTDYWRAAMSKETWFSAQEAIDAGLADGYVANEPAESKPAENDWDLSVFAHARRSDAPPPPAPPATSAAPSGSDFLRLFKEGLRHGA